MLGHPLKHRKLLRCKVAGVEHGTDALLLLTLSHLELLLQLLLKLLVDLRVGHRRRAGVARSHHTRHAGYAILAAAHWELLLPLRLLLLEHSRIHCAVELLGKKRAVDTDWSALLRCCHI